MIVADEPYSNTYTEARDRWLEIVAMRGGRIESVPHTAVSGPDGSALYMDVASFGNEAAGRTYMVVCGTHGIEGFAGSALMYAWLRGGLRSLPQDVRVVLVHAVNPWGFAHGQRVTEENVDLNRNFINFVQPLPANPGYEELHPHLMLEHWTETDIAAAFRSMDGFRAREGEKSFSDAFNGGQYTRSEGLFFGGTRPQWSNVTLREVLRRSEAATSELHVVDLHTGIGPRGRPFFINFDSPDSRQRQRAVAIWGAEALSGTGSTHAVFATYRGLLIEAAAGELPGCAVSTVVIEFGTHPRPVMQRAHLALAWLRRTEESGADRHEVAAARAEYREAFFPSDPDWRRSVIDHGVRALGDGLDAFCRT